MGRVKLNDTVYFYKRTFALSLLPKWIVWTKFKILPFTHLQNVFSHRHIFCVPQKKKSHTNLNDDTILIFRIFIYPFIEIFKVTQN